nr:hypothetical protein [Streptomyces sp. SLBN-118]
MSVKPLSVWSMLCMILSAASPASFRLKVAECVHRQGAAEDPLVELHGLPGVAVEGDVRVEARGHEVFLS